MAKKVKVVYLGYKKISIGLLLIILLLLAYVLMPNFFVKSFVAVTLPQLSTSGFSKVESVNVQIVGDSGVVSLNTKCYNLSAVVEPLQAVSIQNGIDGKVEARPNAHDIMKDIFDGLKVEVLMVKVTEQRESSYFSKFILRQGNTILSLDARPSDAVAVALRVKAPIYVNETLLKQNGRYVC
jgi:bifunctional DNase/RNase